MKKQILLLTLFTCIAIVPLFAESKTEQSAEAMDSKIAEALETVPDRYGIPEGIYYVDRKLKLLQMALKKGSVNSLIPIMEPILEVIMAGLRQESVGKLREIPGRRQFWQPLLICVVRLEKSGMGIANN